MALEKEDSTISHWNYRVVKRVYEFEGSAYETFQIHEAYYASLESLIPHVITENPVEPHGETLEELIRDWAAMRSALDKPILNYEDF